MEQHTFYRLSSHPHLIFTTLEKVKQEALEVIEYAGFEEGSIFHVAVEEWDGKDAIHLEIDDGQQDVEGLELARYELV